MKSILFFSILFLSLILSCVNQEEEKNNNEDIIRNTPPILPSQRNILRVGIIGDLNGSLGDPKYANSVKGGMLKLLKNRFDIVLGTGDFTSGEDYKEKLPIIRFGQMWNSFEKNILQPILTSGIPFAPSPGNHDANILRERRFYKEFWEKRKPLIKIISGETYPFYYSFIYKEVFFISLDNVKTQKLRDRSHNGVTQRQWIIQQLDSAEAREAKARIAYGHVPIYPVLSKKKHGKVGNRYGKYYEILKDEQQGRQRDSLEKIFKQGGLDLAIFGHSHAYYPGIVHHKGELLKDSLKILSMPCLGHGNRFLSKRTSNRSSRGFGQVLIDLNTGDVQYDAYNSKGVLINKGTLPEKITPYSNVSIKRNDFIIKELADKF